jgi:primosomal protein N' (replication factor Y)
VQIIKILLPQIGLFPLDYQLAAEDIVSVGDLVLVPFRHKNITGIVWEINSLSHVGKKLKTIDLNLSEGLNISPVNISFIKKAADYYLSSLGAVAKLVLPVDVNEKPIKYETQNIPITNSLADLALEQIVVTENINKSTKPLLLKGVTGSGKTEIYFHQVADFIKAERQVLIMLPEISLSSQIIDRFTKRFGVKPAIWNSNITKAQKKKLLRGIIRGDIKVVIGARSSLFLPYKDLALIVVDEEHDASYKQGEGILYNARDMAVLKASLTNSKVILVSATPSIETIYNARQGKYEMVELKNRFSEASMPVVEIVDMRSCDLKQNSWLSDQLVAAIKTTVSGSNQCLLFLNRRGYAPLMLCKSCGHRFGCSKCSASMVIHKSSKKMECHHCGAVSKIHETCPACAQPDSLILCGPGVERIEEEVKKIFPNLRIKVATKDQSAKSEEMDELLQQMESGDIDILIGTQIVTKGYHFPKLALVGVIDADLGFVGGDLRSAEKTFQLLHQVGGRAGRDKAIKGQVLLQSYFPDNKVLAALVNGNEEEFIEQEISSRKKAAMPPFTKMAAINITGKYPEKTLFMAKYIAGRAPNSSARILGPAESLMFKLSDRYRYRILIVAEKKFNIQKYISLWLDSCTIPSTFQVKVDIDPYSFY